MEIDTRFLDLDSFVANSFISRDEGLLRGNRFKLFLHPPNNQKLNDAAVKLRLDVQGNFLVWNVLQVSCPNILIDIGSSQVNSRPRYYFKNRQDNDLSIMFLESGDLAIRRYFDEWIKIGFDNMKKERDYISKVWAETVQVFPIDLAGAIDAYDIFHKVIPYSVSNIDYSHDQKDAIVRTEVRFKYAIHDVGSGTPSSPEY